MRMIADNEIAQRSVLMQWISEKVIKSFTVAVNQSLSLTHTRMCKTNTIRKTPELMQMYPNSLASLNHCGVHGFPSLFCAH